MPRKDDEDIRRLLKEVVDHFDHEDRAVRDRQIRMWRRLKLYWDGFQRVWYNEVAHDWRIYDDQSAAGDDQSSYYDKPVNVFRAYLESIIAALSVTIPPIKCTPDDADDPLDISTAKAGSKIAELVYKHNDVTLLWLHALYVYCTEGLVACYNYTKSDKNFGTYKKDKTENRDEEHFFCPECEQILDSTFESPEFDPDSAPELVCPRCETKIDPSLQKSTLTVTRIVGETEHPKTRQMLECHGGLYVKVPNYAMTQEQCPYLFYSYEVHYAVAMERFVELRDRKEWITKTGYDSGGVYEPYERWGRLNPQYYGEYPINTVTLRHCWLRHSSFNILPEESATLLKKKFPDGAKVILANEEIAEDPINEALDDHWTLTRNPLSDYLHHDPLGLLLTSIQDITNEIISLVLQTIEHGIPQTFADPAVLNFDQYRQTEVAPGSIFAAKPKSGRTVGDAFYEIKTATLSGEVMPFGQRIQEFGQLVSGALPSLFGGSAKVGSQTAAEYSMSRAQAQQRLGTTWKMFTVWWKTIFGKVIPSYIKNMEDDERFVKEKGLGNFENVFIRKAEVQGKLGDVECETADQLPITWSQTSEVIMRLIELNNPIFLEALASPENLPFISSVIGLNQFVVPGEADRQKQYEEINLLVNSEPLPSEQPNPENPMEMTEVEIPSVPIDLDVDNHQVEAVICRGWLISEAGQQTKIDNPAGYQNVLLHLKAHIQAMQMMQSPQQESSEGAKEGQP